MVGVVQIANDPVAVWLVGIKIWVIFPKELTVPLLDIIEVGIRVNAENSIWISHNNSYPISPRRRS